MFETATRHTIHIDTSRYTAAHDGLPLDDHFATWTFVIDSTHVNIYGNFADACTLARLQARLWDAPSNSVFLAGSVASGRVHRGRN